MFKSLRSRVISLAALVCACGLALSGVLLFGAHDSRDSFLWVRHTQDVLIQLDAVDSNLRAAEADIRGYVLNGSIAYLDDYDASLAQAADSARRVRALVLDNPPQEARAIRLADAVARRTAGLGALGKKARDGHGDLTKEMAATADDRNQSGSISRQIAVMRTVERGLLDLRTQRADRLSGYTGFLVFLSSPLFLILVGGAAWAIIRGIERPLVALLDAVARFGDGDRAVRVRVNAGASEFRRLGAAYNSMADSLVGALEKQELSEQALALANGELVEHAQILKQRSGSIEVISAMSQLAGAARAGRTDPSARMLPAAGTAEPVRAALSVQQFAQPAGPGGNVGRVRRRAGDLCAG